VSYASTRLAYVPDVELEIHVAGGTVVKAKWPEHRLDAMLKRPPFLKFAKDATDDDKRISVLLDRVGRYVEKGDATLYLDNEDGEWVVPVRAIVAVLYRTQGERSTIGFNKRAELEQGQPESQSLTE
jgi:hypothetical protein